MILFGRIEVGKGGNLGHDWCCPKIAGLCFSERGERVFLLLFIVVENRRSVLGACISPLTVERCGVVRAPKNMQQVAKANDGWVKVNLYDFGVARFTGTYSLIGRIFYLTPAVAGYNSVDADYVLKDSFYAPKSARA